MARLHPLLMQDCEPSNYERVNKKPRCAAIGCKERLNLSNSHVCKHCSAKVCLKHRFPEDHKCTRAKRGGKLASQPHRLALPHVLPFRFMLKYWLPIGPDIFAHSCICLSIFKASFPHNVNIVLLKAAESFTCVNMQATTAMPEFCKIDSRGETKFVRIHHLKLCSLNFLFVACS